MMISDTFEQSIGNIESLTYYNFLFSSQKEICCSIATFSLKVSKTQETLIKSVLQTLFEKSDQLKAMICAVL